MVLLCDIIVEKILTTNFPCRTSHIVHSASNPQNRRILLSISERENVPGEQLSGLVPVISECGENEILG